jgi:hypothetical protein
MWPNTCPVCCRIGFFCALEFRSNLARCIALSAVAVKGFVWFCPLTPEQG